MFIYNLQHNLITSKILFIIESPIEGDSNIIKYTSSTLPYFASMNDLLNNTDS